MQHPEFSAEIRKAAEVLSSGGLLLYPTDTIWGIGCDATKPEAVEKIFQLKKRSDSKSMIILLENESRLASYVDQVPDTAWSLIEYAETPLTIVYDKGRNLARNLLAADGSVGIRITRDPFCAGLLQRFKKPIVSTSANISGHPAPGCFDDIDAEILEGVDYVVNLRRSEKNGNPSKVIRLRGNGQIEFLRK